MQPLPTLNPLPPIPTAPPLPDLLSLQPAFPFSSFPRAIHPNGVAETQPTPAKAPGPGPPGPGPGVVDLQHRVVVPELFLEAGVGTDYWALEFEPGEGLGRGEAVAEG